MHSRIFQIEKSPVAKDEYITSDYIPEWFTNSVADYTSDASDREEDIEWLMSTELCDIASVVGNKLIFSSDVSRYFKKKYESFITAAEILSKTTFDDFVGSNSVYSNIFKLKESYSDRYGFYVYCEDGFLDTLDNFMRGVKCGEIYYIGGVVDYHC